MLLPDFFLTNKAHNFKLPFYCRCKQFQMQGFQGDNSDLHCKRQKTRHTHSKNFQERKKKPNKKNKSSVDYRANYILRVFTACAMR